jgi:hypothetical protein
VHALSPLPAIIKGLKDKKHLDGVSREWIFLSLNNNVIMGTYTVIRYLPDSIMGNIIGTSLFVNELIYQVLHRT